MQVDDPYDSLFGTETFFVTSGFTEQRQSDNLPVQPTVWSTAFL